MTQTPTYRSWHRMLQRCQNPNATQWKHYGGRGITVCERWSRFEYFLEDMGLRPDKFELDRIDVDGNYEKANCRWVTHKQNMNNTRGNRQVTYNGETKTMTEWAASLGIKMQTLWARFEDGWTVERALMEPVWWHHHNNPNCRRLNERKRRLPS